VAVAGNVSIVPSPQTTFTLVIEPPVFWSVAVIVNVIVWPVVAVVVFSVKLTNGTLLGEIVLVDVALPANVSIVPSPHTTFRLLTAPSGSPAAIVRMIDVSVGADVADSVKLIVGALSEIVLIEVVLSVTDPELSVALT